MKKRYTIYSGNNKFKIPNFQVGYKNNIKPRKHRAEIEEYIENMEEPSISIDENGVATFTFEPIPEQMAKWMVESKAVKFKIVRNVAGSSCQCFTDKTRKKTREKDWISNFQYSWEAPYSINTYSQGGTYYPPRGCYIITIPYFENIDSNITIQELQSGIIIRDLTNGGLTNIFNMSSKYHRNKEVIIDKYGAFSSQFYIGILYTNSRNIPFLYKMSPYYIEY